jgi:NAD(P)H-dependent FMN reductase
MHLRAVLAELGMPSIPSIFPISGIYSSIDENGKAEDEQYNKRVIRFIDEFEWYVSALKAQRETGVPY